MIIPSPRRPCADRCPIQRFCKEVVTWKTLQHPNILPLIGVTMSEGQFSMISNWMSNGNINEFVKANPNVNRLKLVGFSSYISFTVPVLTWFMVE